MSSSRFGPDHASPSSGSVMPQSLRKRAGKACSFCQWRKRRCDVEQKHPCSNCMSEKINCSITKTRKRRSIQSQLNADARNPSQVRNKSVAATRAELEDVEGLIPGIGTENTATSDVEAVSENEPHASAPDRRLDQEIQSRSFSREPSHRNDKPPKGAAANTTEQSLIETTLPAYIEPMPTHLPQDDIDYLQNKGCFQIPALEFRDSLLRSYAEFFHPYLPLLHLAKFLHAVTATGPPHDRVSLLLFQAVMFAGSAHVDIKPLRVMGFLTRKAARRALFLKTKALYDMEYERDRLTVIQALAIMSFWHDTIDDQKSPSHWLHIGFSLGVRAGLDQDPAAMNVSETERRMRRRIWWSCVNRDPLCALGTKAPLSVYSEHPMIPELTMEDFDLGDAFAESFDKIRIWWPPEKKRLLCLASMAQMQLHQLLRKILAGQYSLRDHRGGSGTGDGASSRMVLMPLTTESARQKIKELDESLRAWLTSLPKELQQSTGDSEGTDASLDSFLVFRAVLHMLYRTCFITLYRPWLRSGHGSTNEGYFQKTAQASVRDSSHAITQLALELYKFDLVRHLPQTGISALVAAVVSHISDMVSPFEHLRQTGLQGYEQCLHILGELRDNYYSADFSTEFVKLLAQAKKLSQVPMEAQNGLGERFHDHVSAHSGFIASDLPVVEEAAERSSGPSLNQPLPAVLVPQGFSLPTVLGTDAAGWIIGGGENYTLEDPLILPPNSANGMDDYRGLREETVRLLGDVYDDSFTYQLDSSQEFDLGLL